MKWRRGRAEACGVVRAHGGGACALRAFCWVGAAGADHSMVCLGGGAPVVCKGRAAGVNHAMVCLAVGYAWGR